jgi:DNA-binding NarL/FixJ family response regulator
MPPAMDILPVTPLQSTAIRVAVVEDDPSFRDAFVAAVDAASDMRMTEMAATVKEAVAMLCGPAPDVLVVDLGLPDGSGTQVIRHAHMAWPACAILVATTFADETNVLAAIEAGAAGYLLKDSPADRIAAEVRTVHAGGSPISPMIARRLLTRMQAVPQAAALAPAAGPTTDSMLLSSRETQVLELVAKGFTFEQIGRKLEVSHHTVQTFVRRAYAKLEVSSKMEAVNAARRKGLLRD